jgi:hypothetical protein
MTTSTPISSANRLIVALLSIFIVTSVVGIGTAQAGKQTIKYADAKPYFKLMEESAKKNPKKSVTVKTHSEKLKQVDPSNLKTLTSFVLSTAQNTSSGKATIVDRKYMIINERLSLCLGVTKLGQSMMNEIMVCQEFKTNQLNKLIIRNGSGKIVGEYVVKFE